MELKIDLPSHVVQFFARKIRIETGSDVYPSQVERAILNLLEETAAKGKAENEMRLAECMTVVRNYLTVEQEFCTGVKELVHELGYTDLSPFEIKEVVKYVYSLYENGTIGNLTMHTINSNPVYSKTIFSPELRHILRHIKQSDADQQLVRIHVPLNPKSGLLAIYGTERCATDNHEYTLIGFPVYIDHQLDANEILVMAGSQEVYRYKLDAL